MSEPKEDQNKALEIAQKIRASNGAVCDVYFSEFRKQPGADAALVKVGFKEIGIEAIKYRAPVYGSIILGMDVAEQAVAKYKSGDIKGSVAAIVTATAVTSTALVPLIPGIGLLGGIMPLGDGVVEAARGLGVNIEKSPIHNTYNTAMGTKQMCERLGATARLMDAPTKPMTREQIVATAKDVLLITEKSMSPDEIEAFHRLVTRVVKTHAGISNVKESDARAPLLTPAKPADSAKLPLR